MYCHLMKDSAMAHTAKCTVAAQPPRLPELNACDYYLCVRVRTELV